MSNLLDESLRVIQALNAEGVEYIVVGGVAMNVHGLLRATEDLDLFIRPTPDNVSRLKRSLRAVWDDPSIDEVSAEDLCGDYPAVRYGPPQGDLYLDILTRLGEFAEYAQLDFEVIRVGGVDVRVATPGTLVWMKRGTVRAIDHSDARRLQEAFDLDIEE